eukprot:CAMPEP_0194245976 /NCGR_PEP_ID=MMETSP0158-20130606/14216_1 /TAXON_ID=33649 /ORGANISM="Thalassionema nitzschioides, Strain L26-B" /LENGTH=316 /DNA_ID=CAMNT_0038981779 /DNA_START=191 /DNA_END=1138 /DNA_ORIENTATION=-
MTERKIATKSTTTNWCIPGTVRTEAAVESGSSGECDATLIGNRFMITSQQCSHWTVSGVGTSKFTPNDSDEELKVQFIDRTYYYSDNAQTTTPSTTDFQYAVLDLNAKVGSSTSGPCNTDLSTCSSNAFCSDDHAIVVSVPESTADAKGVVTCLELQQAISDDGVGLGCDNNTNDAAALEQVIETVCRCEMIPPPRPAMQQIPPPMPGSIFSSVAPTSTPAHTRKPPQKSNFQASSQGGKKMPNGALVGIIVTVVLLVFTLGLGFYYFVWKGGKLSKKHRKLRRTDSVAAIEIKGSSEETDRTSDDTTTDEVELKK